MCAVVVVDSVGVHSFLFFKQKTAYDVRISDWSSDVCSSDLPVVGEEGNAGCILAAGGAFAVLFGMAWLLEKVMPTSIARTIAWVARVEIGRASCRERGCPYVYISVVAVSTQKTTMNTTTDEYENLQTTKSLQNTDKNG